MKTTGGLVPRLIWLVTCDPQDSIGVAISQGLKVTRKSNRLEVGDWLGMDPEGLEKTLRG